ncbi:MAG TPA: hypothetical protein VNZ06_05955 [Steroidobacteraceae bacterium]|nr:hypothetical protein [Steroidobacteraceae bacterium]
MNARVAILSVLSLWMLATRFGHFGSRWSLPDASWAIFFVGGFYLSRCWRSAFAWLLGLAVGIDLSVIQFYGVSNYCLTPAYAFNLPAYAVLWFSGAWLQRHLRGELADLLRLGASAFIALSVCFVISNGSFYWLGGRVRTVSLAGWTLNFADWYASYLGNALLYIAIACVVQVALTRRAGASRAWRPH